MFVRASTLVFAIATSVVASPGGIMPIATDNCNDNQSLYCCDQTETASSSAASGLVDLLGLDNVAGLIGVDCDPIGVANLGSGTACTAQSVCCTNEKQVGPQLFGLDCSPVNVVV